MYGHFYDNSYANRDTYSLCPYILFHKVYDNPRFAHGDSAAFVALVQRESADVRKLAQMYIHHFKHTHFDPLSGNHLQTGEEFFQHVIQTANAPNVSTILFDWDRTLQQFECMTTRSYAYWCAEMGARTDEEKRALSKSMAVLHSGGTERFLKLRHMFAHIQLQKKNVYIVTANPAVLSAGYSIYLEIIRMWGLGSFKIVYSTDIYGTFARDAGLSIHCGPQLEY